MLQMEEVFYRDMWKKFSTEIWQKLGQAEEKANEKKSYRIPAPYLACRFFMFTGFTFIYFSLLSSQFQDQCLHISNYSAYIKQHPAPSLSRFDIQISLN